MKILSPHKGTQKVHLHITLEQVQLVSAWHNLFLLIIFRKSLGLVVRLSRIEVEPYILSLDWVGLDSKGNIFAMPGMPASFRLVGDAPELLDCGLDRLRLAFVLLGRHGMTTGTAFDHAKAASLIRNRYSSNRCVF